PADGRHARTQHPHEARLPVAHRGYPPRRRTQASAVAEIRQPPAGNTAMRRMLKPSFLPRLVTVEPTLEEGEGKGVAMNGESRATIAARRSRDTVKLGAGSRFERIHRVLLSRTRRASEPRPPTI